MRLSRWDPFRELEEMRARLNQLSEDRQSRPRAPGREVMTVADWAPVVDIAETAAEYLIEVELPEVKKEDVRINLLEGVLTIEGERRQDKDEKDKKFHRIERSYGMFRRSFTMPNEVDANKVSAEYKDGMLTLHLPKSERVETRAIDVKIE
ncbi:Hsp20/alpha crystallin family protein [bacterium]|nr:Hsp20/alpha crystallin family protein [bacterium]